VTNGSNVYVRLGALKLCLAHLVFLVLWKEAARASPNVEANSGTLYVLFNSIRGPLPRCGRAPTRD
jgi:hypothetical protein